jgi:ubiquinone/menaquinone biosynthesis C-methylase UbiE
MIGMTGSNFSGTEFSSSARDTELVASSVLELIPKAGEARILDVGCGDGAVVERLAQRQQNISIVGVDISKANIDLARALAVRTGASARASFSNQDYLTFSDGMFDLIYSNSVLDLLAAPPASLARKLSRDLKDEGRLMVIMPNDCFPNRLLIVLRRLLRVLRSRLLEKIVLALAKFIYPGWTEGQLRDRLPYLYVVPHHLDSAVLRSVFESAGLEAITRRPWPAASIFKLRHSLVIYRKRPDTPVVASLGER